VAELARFYGIVIAIYFREHGVPHIHVSYAGRHASISIRSGRVLEGESRFHPPALRLVKQWLEEHQEELLDAWEDARNGRRPRKIRPLK
jgi:hypothetical protein